MAASLAMDAHSQGVTAIGRLSCYKVRAAIESLRLITAQKRVNSLNVRKLKPAHGTAQNGWAVRKIRTVKELFICGIVDCLCHWYMFQNSLHK